MSDFIKNYKVKLKTITPISIKSGVNKNYYEFFVGKDNVYFINQNELLTLLSEQKIDGKKAGYDVKYIDILTKKIFSNDKSSEFTLKKIIEDLGFEFEESHPKDQKYLEEISYYKTRNKTIKPGKTINTLIRDSFYKPFIPGSSIKGAFRTAIYAFVFSELQEKNLEFLKKQNWLYGQNKYNQTVNNILLKELLIHTKTNFNRNDQLIYDAKTDIMKFIGISDAKPVKNVETAIINFEVFGMKTQGNQEVNFVDEVILPGAEFEFELRINHNIFLKLYEKHLKHKVETRNFPKATEILSKEGDDIIFYNELWSQKIIETEKKYWETRKFKNQYLIDFYNKLENETDGLFRIGMGSGATSLTLASKLKEIGIDVKTNKETDMASPATRKLAKIDGIDHPYGWCKLEIKE